MRIWITALADLARDKGSTRHLRELAAGLAARGHQVTLFVSRESPLAAEPGIAPVPAPRVPLPGLRYFSGLVSFQLFLLARLLRRARRERPDVLYGRHDAFLLAPALFAGWKKVPLVTELNGVLPFELRLRGHGRLGLAIDRRIERFVYGRSRRVVAVAEGMKAYLTRDLGVDPAKVAVSANGADLARFTPGESPEVRARLGARPGDVVVGYVGGLQPYQGVAPFLAAVGRLIGEGLPVRALVVGGGAEEAPLRAAAGTGPLAGRVLMTGAVPYRDVPAYVRALDVGVLPKLRRVPGSPHEYSASPLKAFEYMACGKPIAANDAPDFRFLADCGAAVCAGVEDPAAFASALRALVVSADLRARMGEAGLRYAREHGSWDASIGRVDAVLREAVGK